jgi:hypothetical protein
VYTVYSNTENSDATAAVGWIEIEGYSSVAILWYATSWTVQCMASEVNKQYFCLIVVAVAKNWMERHPLIQNSARN